MVPFGDPWAALSLFDNSAVRHMKMQLQIPGVAVPDLSPWDGFTTSGKGEWHSP
jgi:hypothetical protein